MGSSTRLGRIESFESSETKRIRRQHGDSDGRFLCETGLLSGVWLGGMNEETVERTGNGERINIFAHRSRNANCYFVISCKFNSAEFRGKEGEFPVVQLKWKLAAQTVSRCERRDLRSRLTDNFVRNFARRDETRHVILLLY